VSSVASDRIIELIRENVDLKDQVRLLVARVKKMESVVETARVASEHKRICLCMERLIADLEALDRGETP
jgi:hypothetical protein